MNTTNAQGQMNQSDGTRSYTTHSSTLLMPDNTRTLITPSRSSITSPPASNGEADVERKQSQLPQPVAWREGYIALGSIITRSVYDEENKSSKVLMQSRRGEAIFSSSEVHTAHRKGWLFIEDLTNGNDGASRLRIYILPEDVQRGRRGSIADCRKLVTYLFDFIDRSMNTWLGKNTSGSIEEFYEIPTVGKEESLFYIFNTLQSPSPDLSALEESTHAYSAVYDTLHGTIAGLKTQLYQYQKRSVAAMIQKEIKPAKVLDARKTVFRDLLGRQFFLDMHNGRLLSHAPLYDEPSGGILAETMGYGKTLICIALVLATRGHYPKIPEGRVDCFPVYQQQHVSSLFSMVARRIKHEGVPYKAEFDAFAKQGEYYDDCILELNKYDRAYFEPLFTPTTAHRPGKREANVVVRLCPATLVIVPPNLLGQWQHEINKHVDGNLDILVIDQPTQKVPGWKDLLRNDIVLMTKSRFEQEYRDDDLNQGKARRGEARYKSPLTEVRWLRVICDEGHGFAGSSSRTHAMAMLDKMFIERRWVVSGTPSSTLHGVEVDLATSVSTPPTMSRAGSPATSIEGRRESIGHALNSGRMVTARYQEAKDLERLRLMCVNFLKLQPWANKRDSSDSADWKRYLTPIVCHEGERRSQPALRDVLQTLIVRHRIEDIDTDLALPPLHNKIVYLEPSYHDRLALNMFTLVLASNYVTSEREDEDYMFHPRNRKKFDILVNNLRQASFHWVGFSEHDIRETLRISNEYLDKNFDKVSDADALLLTKGLMYAERALADPAWRAFSMYHEIGVYVKDFPDHACHAWALDEQNEDNLLLGTTQARAVQKYFKDKVSRGQHDPLSGLVGAGLKTMNAARAAAEDAQKEKTKSRAAINETQVGAIEEPKLPVRIASISKSTISPTKSSPRKRKASKAFSDSLLRSASIHSFADPDIPETTITGFSSAKLSYLMSQLLIHSPNCKSIIFYSSNNVAFWIAEALELLHIPFLIYANTLSVPQRNAYLSTFNTDNETRVLLMDLKQASHGLHVASASRVYIVTPIWERGVEAQAVKRAHRIGQVNEVYVETLVLSGTFEEEVVRRRRMEMEVDQGTSKQREGGMLDDRYMVNALKNIQFLGFSRGEEDGVNGRIARLNSSGQGPKLFSGLASSNISAVQSRIVQDIHIDAGNGVRNTRGESELKTNHDKGRSELKKNKVVIFA